MISQKFIDIYKCKEFSFSSEEMQKQLLKYTLEFNGTRIEEIQKTSFPMFVFEYYNYIYHKKHIPNQNDFWNYYMEVNSNHYTIRSLDKRLIYGLKARASRAYTSLVREMHCIKFVKECSVFDVVKYNLYLDVHKGIDMLIQHNKKLIGVSLFIETKESLKYRKQKKHRHNPDDRFIYMDLPLNFRGSKQCGSYYLYGERELNKLKTMIFEL